MVRKVQVEKYYPDVIAPSKEFRLIGESENPELEQLYQKFYQWFLNGFVMDIDEEGAKRWESMLNLIPKSGDSLEERRKRILGKINAMTPYTHRRLMEMLAARYGEGVVSFELLYHDYKMIVDIPRNLMAKAMQLWVYLRAIVPANLDIRIHNTRTIPNRCYAGAVVTQKRRASIGMETPNRLDKARTPIFGGGNIRIYKKMKVEVGG